MTQAEIDTRELLSAYADAWAALAGDGIARFWAPERFLLYKAEEIGRLFHAWADVLAYWHSNETLHDSVALSFRDIVVKPLGDGRRLVTARMDWRIRFAAAAPAAIAGHAMAADNHVVMILVEEAGAWRFILWSETPDAPVAAIRKFYRHRAGDL